MTLPAAKKLEGVYDAWLMDDATPIEKAVTNDNSAEHYYTLQGAARFVARLNGLLGSWTGKEYTTLQAALDEAAKKTGTASIDLLADVGEQVTATTENNPITLNLNGYTLTGKITLTNGQNTNAFTLTDETADDYKAGSIGGVLTGPANGIEMGKGKSSTIRNTLKLKGETLTLTNLYRGVSATSGYADISADDVTFTQITNGGVYTSGGYCNVQVANVTYDDGKYYNVNNSYTTATQDNYVGKKYVAEYGTIEKDGSQVVGMTSDKDETVGTLRFNGLKEGTYTITEVLAPTGYKKLDKPITVKIDWIAPNLENDETECKWTYDDVSREEEGVVTPTKTDNSHYKIVNRHGLTLPFTGGEGANLLAGLGLALMAAAVAAILYIKRRQNRE